MSCRVVELCFLLRKNELQLINSSTHQLNNSTTQQLNNSTTQQLNNSTTQQLMSTRQRVITGVIFGAIVIIGMLAHQWSYRVVFLLIGALCLWEFLNMTLEGEPKGWALSRKVLGVALGLLPAFVAVGWLNESLVLYIFAAGVFLLLPIELFAQAKLPFANVAQMFMGILYIGFPIALAIVMGREQGGNDFSPFIVFGILLMVWASDVAAYFGGRAFGKRKLFPRISPKKTWEGAISGLFGAVAVGALIYFVYQQLPISRTLDLKDWLILGATTAVFGITGDLVESMLKRSVNIKDSGNLLPGHGGFLDRFDAFIFVIPFAYLYLMLFS